MSDIVNSINGVNVPVQPDKGSFTIKPETIWSSNTGRTATGLMVGDIVATKHEFSMEWTNLSDANTMKILNAVSGKAFFSFKYTPSGGATKTVTVYRASGSPQMTKGNGGYYSKVTLSLVEQ